MRAEFSARIRDCYECQASTYAERSVINGEEIHTELDFVVDADLRALSVFDPYAVKDNANNPGEVLTGLEGAAHFNMRFVWSQNVNHIIEIYLKNSEELSRILAQRNYSSVMLKS